MSAEGARKAAVTSPFPDELGTNGTLHNLHHFFPVIHINWNATGGGGGIINSVQFTCVHRGLHD